MKWIVSKTNSPTHLETITEAITLATDYDEIHIYTGHYKEKLIINKEILGSQIASFHNLNFYLWLVKEARKNIKKDTFHTWKEVIIPKLNNRL